MDNSLDNYMHGPVPDDVRRAYVELRSANNRRAGIFLHVLSIIGDAPIRAEQDLPGAVADIIAERDRLRAVVDAVRMWRDSKMRIFETDESDMDRADQIETARQVMWLALAKWEEGLDGSPAMGDDPHGGEWVDL